MAQPPEEDGRPQYRGYRYPNRKQRQNGGRRFVKLTPEDRARIRDEIIAERTKEIPTPYKVLERRYDLSRQTLYMIETDQVRVLAPRRVKQTLI